MNVCYEISEKYIEFMRKKFNYSESTIEKIYSYTRTIVRYKLFDTNSIRGFCYRKKKSDWTYRMLKNSLIILQKFCNENDIDIESMNLIEFSQLNRKMKRRKPSNDVSYLNIINTIYAILRLNNVSNPKIIVEERKITITW